MTECSSLHLNISLLVGVHLREAVAIARRKRYGTGSSTAQHEEQLEKWIRKSDAFVDLSNHKQPAQLVLDVSLWQLRRQFRRIPCFNNEVRAIMSGLPCAFLIVGESQRPCTDYCMRYNHASLKLRACLSGVLKTNSRTWQP